MKRLFGLFILSLLLTFTPNVASAGESYTITYRDWNDNYLYEDVVDSGQSGYFHTAVRIGYDFVGWGTDAETLDNSVLVNVTEDRTAYAIYTPKVYDVLFLAEDDAVLLETKMDRDAVPLLLTEELMTLYPNSMVVPKELDSYEPIRFIRDDVYMNSTTLMFLVETNYDITVTVVEIPEKDGFTLDGFIVEPIQGNSTFYPNYEEIPVEELYAPELEYDNSGEYYTVIDLSEKLEVMGQLGETEAVFPDILMKGVHIILERADLETAQENQIDLVFNVDGAKLVIPSNGMITLLKSDFDEVELVVYTSFRDSYILSDRFEATVLDGYLISMEVNGFPIPHYMQVTIPGEVVVADQEHILATNTNSQVKSAEYTIVSLTEIVEEETETPTEPPITEEPVEEESSFTVLRKTVDGFVVNNLLYSPVALIGLFILVYAGVELVNKKK